MEDFNKIKDFYLKYLINLNNYCSQIQIQIQIQNIENFKDQIKEKKNLEILYFIKSHTFQDFLNNLYKQICDKLNESCAKFKSIKNNSNKTNIFNKLNDLNKKIIDIKDIINKYKFNIQKIEYDINNLKLQQEKLISSPNPQFYTTLNQQIEQKKKELINETKELSQEKDKLKTYESQKFELEKSLTHKNSYNKNVFIHEYKDIIDKLKNNIVLFIELQKYIRKNNIKIDCFKDGLITYLFNINNSNTNLLELYINYLLLNTSNPYLKEYIDIQNLMKELELKNRFYQNNNINSKIIKKQIPKKENRNKNNKNILNKSLLKNEDFKYIFNYIVNEYSQLLTKETIIELTNLKDLNLNEIIEKINSIKNKYIINENNYSQKSIQKYTYYKSKGLFDLYNKFRKDLKKILYNLKNLFKKNKNNNQKTTNQKNTNQITTNQKTTNQKKKFLGLF